MHRLASNICKSKRCYYSLTSLIKLKDQGYFESLLPQSSDKHLGVCEEISPLTVYCGFDPTAESLQIGNLIPFIGLLRAQILGHKSIALVGGATGIIGDPTGRNQSRPVLSSVYQARNSNSFEKCLKLMCSNFNEQIRPFFPQSNSNGSCIILNNYEWLNKMTMLDFLIETADFVRLQELLHKESVRIREVGGTGMSVKEFLYPLIQAHDFLHLHKIYQCSVQIGGNDQIGNIDSGIALIRRKCKKNVFGLTVPLLTSPDGTKFGKSLYSGGHIIWLDKHKLRPFHFYQYLINLPDVLMTGSIFKMFTFFSDSEINDIIVKNKKFPEKRFAQRSLAREVTLLVHGGEFLQACELASRVLFTPSFMFGTPESPFSALSHVSSKERDFLLNCLSYQQARVDSPLPVVFDIYDQKTSFFTRLAFILKQTVLNESDREMALKSIQSSISLNYVKLNDASSDDQMKRHLAMSNLITSSNSVDDDLFAREICNCPEGTIQDAFNRRDQSTGISILKIGKRCAWFVIPKERIQICVESV